MLLIQTKIDKTGIQDGEPNQHQETMIELLHSQLTALQIVQNEDYVNFQAHLDQLIEAGRQVMEVVDLLHDDGGFLGEDLQLGFSVEDLRRALQEVSAEPRTAFK